MKCFRCLVDYQANDGSRDEINDALYVYNGESLCGDHVNIVRGLESGFVRYPPPFHKEWWEHCRDAHELVIAIGSPQAIHHEDHPECTWTPEGAKV